MWFEAQLSPPIGDRWAASDLQDTLLERCDQPEEVAIATRPEEVVPARVPQLISEPTERHEPMAEPEPNHEPTVEPVTESAVQQELPPALMGETVAEPQVEDCFERGGSSSHTEPARKESDDTAEGTPVPQSEKLQKFLGAVKKKIASPLAAKPARTKAPTSKPMEDPAGSGLPKRSRRIAQQPLANVASSKRAEIILMRRFDIAAPSGPITATTKKAYHGFFEGKLDSADMAAANELFPALRRNLGTASGGTQLAF
ncbi:unnamed protein product [Urochloa humidicola]